MIDRNALIGNGGDYRRLVARGLADTNGIQHIDPGILVTVGVPLGGRLFQNLCNDYRNIAFIDAVIPIGITRQQGCADHDRPKQYHNQKERQAGIEQLFPLQKNDGGNGKGQQKYTKQAKRGNGVYSCTGQAHPHGTVHHTGWNDSQGCRISQDHLPDLQRVLSNRRITGYMKADLEQLITQQSCGRGVCNHHSQLPIGDHRPIQCMPCQCWPTIQGYRRQDRSVIDQIHLHGDRAAVRNQIYRNGKTATRCSFTTATNQVRRGQQLAGKQHQYPDQADHEPISCPNSRCIHGETLSVVVYTRESVHFGHSLS